jgi:bud site selection protein 31
MWLSWTCRGAAKNDPHDGKTNCAALWAVAHLQDQSPEDQILVLYDLYYNRKEVPRELYEFCLDQGHADPNLLPSGRRYLFFTSP